MTNVRAIFRYSKMSQILYKYSKITLFSCVRRLGWAQVLFRLTSIV